jgi:UDP-2,3-diacylglucosamine pyrophosphatase LpxH
LADSHIEGPGGEPEALLEQLEVLPARGFDHLVLLGDILHLWIGLTKVQTRGAKLLCHGLKQIRQRGVFVDYVEGNRDFFLEPLLAQGAFDRLGVELTLEVGSRRCLFVHGDRVPTGDWAYAGWRGLSKSGPVRWIVSALPAGVAWSIAQWMERRLAKSNFSHRDFIPERRLRKFAEKQLRKGFDLVILGHFHEERKWDLEMGSVWVVEAWFRSRRIEVLEAASPSFGQA